MSPFGFFRALRAFIFLGAFVLFGVLMLGRFVVVEILIESDYRQHYGDAWQAEYEKYHGPLSQAHMKIAVAAGALVAVIGILVWLYRKNAPKWARHGHRSSARRKSSRRDRGVVREQPVQVTQAVQPVKPATLPPFRPVETRQPDWRAVTPLKIGQQLGTNFNIYDVLGRGGFGVVYLVFDLESRALCALKTFRDELLVNSSARAAFKQEASHWVDLGEHPHILFAHSVLEISHRLFVRMDYVAPDEEGRVTLAHYLRGNSRKVIGLENQLEWGVQFCLGMEHANQHGILCHRDIKPENILITADGVLKISDFGLAVASEDGPAEGTLPGPAPAKDPEDGYIGLSLVKAGNRNLCGTPGYIPPEVFCGRVADVRSDIYSFGLVLWQMAAQSAHPPFAEPFLKGDVYAHMAAICERQLAGDAPAVEGPMQPLIARCLARERAHRYANFTELREELETLLWQQSGKLVSVPRETQKTADTWYHRGVSMTSVGRYDDALAAFDQALQLAPQDVKSLTGRLAVLSKLGRWTECLRCHDQIIARQTSEAKPWNDKGAFLGQQDRLREALVCFNEALTREPGFALALMNKGIMLSKLDASSDALVCLEAALAINPKLASAWTQKGCIFLAAKQYLDAVKCFEKALALRPKSALGWFNKGLAEDCLKDNRAAIDCFTKYLELAQPHELGRARGVRARIQKLKENLFRE